jgi:hypothetical protein
MADLYARRIWLLTIVLIVALSLAFGLVQGR